MSVPSIEGSMGREPTLDYPQNVVAMGSCFRFRNEVIVDAQSRTRLDIEYALLLAYGVEAQSSASININTCFWIQFSVDGIILGSHACCKPMRGHRISRSIVADG